MKSVENKYWEFIDKTNQEVDSWPNWRKQWFDLLSTASTPVKLKPLIKYSGAKFCRIAEIEKLLPKTYKDVYIPFLGGGSFLSFFKYKNIYASDVNQDVIAVFNQLLLDRFTLKQSYAAHHQELKLKKNLYYEEIKSLFNKNRRPTDFLFLTRACYNGLIRYNQKGEFNVGFHHTRDGIQPEKLNLVIDEWYNHVKLNNIKFKVEDYRLTIENSTKDDLILADPPYIKTKGQYLGHHFDFKLFEYQFNKLTEQGVKWLITLDEDRELVHQTMPKLEGNFYSNSAKRSSLSNLKNKKVYKSDTIITNYDN